MIKHGLAGIGIVVVFFMTTSVSAQVLEQPQNQKDKVSYSIGMEIGRNLKRQPMDINPEFLARGIRDAFSDGKPLLEDKEMNEVLTNLQKEMMAKQQEAVKKLGEKNSKEGEAFLAENKKKEGVITLPSGLQYKVIKEGSGKKPQLTDTVTAHYRGTLIDGTEFDSSYRRGQPVNFPVKGVIPGWTEALQLMQEGSKWQVVIPSNLAYGERGAGREIGPHATLVFEIELLSVQEQK